MRCYATLTTYNFQPINSTTHQPNNSVMKHRYSPALAEANYDAIVIGSGIGGLTTAVLLAKAGKKVLVLEQHYEPGGFSHTFKRKNFVWDVGIHYVGQVNIKGALLKKAFDYLSDSKLKWSDMGDVYDQVVIGNSVYNFRSGYENQLNQLIGYFPKEENGIREYFKLLKKISARSVMFFSERTMPGWLSKTAGYFLRRGFYKYSDRTTYDVISDFTSNQQLIAVLCAQCGNYGLPPKKSCFSIHAMIVDHFLEGGNYPVGGASSIHRTFTEALEARNGVLAIKAAVKNIIIKNNKAVGVEMQNGDKIFGKKIISNAGAHNTFNKLISNGSTDHITAEAVNSIAPSISHVCLYIGLNESDAALHLPKHNIWYYENSDIDASVDKHHLDSNKKSPVVYISFPSAKDPSWQTLHPGTAAIQVVGSFPFAGIKEFENTQWHKRGDEYNKIKEEVSEFLMQKLIDLVPQVKGKIAWSELSTPLSTQHFSGYTHGEMYGLEHSPQRFRVKELRPRTKFKNLYLTGQDIVCVGVGAALFSGIITAVSVLNRNLLWSIFKHKIPDESETA